MIPVNYLSMEKWHKGAISVKIEVNEYGIGCCVNLVLQQGVNNQAVWDADDVYAPVRQESISPKWQKF